MPNPVPLEQWYYDALRSGMEMGSAMTGNEWPDELPPDVEQSLRRQAKEKARRTETQVLKDPEVQARVTATVDEWLAQEGTLSFADLARALAPEFGFDRAMRIARTEASKTLNYGAAASAKANGFEMVDWLAALDACEECKSKEDDNPYTMDEYMAMIDDEHPNGRCTFTIHLEDEEEESAELETAYNDAASEDDDAVFPMAASGPDEE